MRAGTWSVPSLEHLALRGSDVLLLGRQAPACARPIPSSRWSNTVLGQQACGSDVCARRGKNAGPSAQSGRAGSPRDPAAWKWVHIPAGLSGGSSGTAGGAAEASQASAPLALCPVSPHEALPDWASAPLSSSRGPGCPECLLKRGARSPPQARVPASPGWARTPGRAAVSLLEFPTLAALRIAQDAID